MVRVLLFAELQERIGKTSLKIPLEKANVRQLKEKLESDYPQLRLKGVMTAVNEEYAKDDDIVTAGDTVALIPPVSGG